MSSSSGAQVNYAAASGEANNVKIARPCAGSTCITNYDWVVIEDHGAPISPGNGCLPLSPTKVECRAHYAPIDRAAVLLGDQPDQFELTVALPQPSFIGGNAGTDVLRGGPGSENLFGGSEHDLLFGGGGCDLLDGQGGDDVLDGQAGPDTLHGGAGTDTADYSTRTADIGFTPDGTLGGATAVCSNSPPTTANDGASGEGDDVLSTVENVNGGSGNDHLRGTSGDNILVGNGGDDWFDGQAGADRMVGGPGTGDRAVYATRTNGVKVTLDGVANDGEPGEGDNVETSVETVFGGSGADRLVGHAGVANLLIGLGDHDFFDGGEGPCSLLCLVRPDEFRGGSGTDTVDYSRRNSPLTVTLSSSPSANDGAAGEGDHLDTIENVIGGTANDTLIGDGAGNRLVGGRGFDSLSGGDGPDVLESVDALWKDGVDCGPGTDLATVDVQDGVTACENVTTVKPTPLGPGPPDVRLP